MRVAIVGAGLSGLSCAIELKKLGIEAVVYEKSETLGDRPGYLISDIRLLSRSFINPTLFMKRRYGVLIPPEYELKKIEMHSHGNKCVVKGNLGLVYKKGFDEDSLEHRLLGGNDLHIKFNNKIEDFRALAKDFDRVVIANADGTAANTLNTWTVKLEAHCRIAKVSGAFEKGVLKYWVNTDYFKNGYGYLIAQNSRTAELICAVTDIRKELLEHYWNEFILCEGLKFGIIDVQDIFVSIGKPSAPMLDCFYFTGNAGGMIEDFIGTGFLRSVESGILAARAIAYGLDYNKLLKALVDQVDAMHAYREMVNTFTNEDYDKTLSLINLPLVKPAIYNNPLFRARFFSFLPARVAGLKSGK